MVLSLWMASIILVPSECHGPGGGNDDGPGGRHHAHHSVHWFVVPVVCAQRARGIDLTLEVSCSLFAFPEFTRTWWFGYKQSIKLNGNQRTSRQASVRALRSKPIIVAMECPCHRGVLQCVNGFQCSCNVATSPPLLWWTWIITPNS